MELISYQGYQAGGQWVSACLVAVCHEGKFGYEMDAEADCPHVIEFIPVIPNLRDQLRLLMNVKRDDVLRNIYQVAAAILPVGSYIVGTTNWTENDLKPIPGSKQIYMVDPTALGEPPCRRYYETLSMDDYEVTFPAPFAVVDFVGGCAAIQLGDFTRAIVEEFKDYHFVMRQNEVYVEPMSFEETLLASPNRQAILWSVLNGRARFRHEDVVLGSFKDVTLTNVTDQHQDPLGVLDLNLEQEWEGQPLDPKRLRAALRRLFIDEPDCLAAWGLYSPRIDKTEDFSGRLLSMSGATLKSPTAYKILANGHSWCTLAIHAPATSSDMATKESVFEYMKGHSLCCVEPTKDGGSRICEVVVLKEANYLAIKHNLHQETKTYIASI